jgi:hypothetical protein
MPAIGSVRLGSLFLASLGVDRIDKIEVAAFGGGEIGHEALVDAVRIGDAEGSVVWVKRLPDADGTLVFRIGERSGTASFNYELDPNTYILSQSHP